MLSHLNCKLLPDVQTNILVPRSYRILTLPPYSELELHLVEVFRMTLFRVVFSDDAHSNSNQTQLANLSIPPDANNSATIVEAL